LAERVTFGQDNPSGLFTTELAKFIVFIVRVRTVTSDSGCDDNQGSITQLECSDHPTRPIMDLQSLQEIIGNPKIQFSALESHSRAWLM